MGLRSQLCSARSRNFSFADGHVEHWRWDKPKIFTELGQLVGQDGEISDFQRVQRGVKSATK
ncbi:MAG: hypothetical protein D4R45_06280 [Planctomycetaceae bacterium]|nr:MAG: hypothetical protein D4R45_06280 [Planctomycetaceae bacterium]